MKKIKYLLVFLIFLHFIVPYQAAAQVTLQPTENANFENIDINNILMGSSLSAVEASRSAAEQEELEAIEEEDITKPERIEKKSEIINRFQERPADELTFFNGMAYVVQYAVRIGVPANTIVLILLVPFLASFIAFIRIIIGLPTMELLVPIILSVAFVATGVTVGSIILFAVLFGSVVSRIILKRIRIMQLPKMSFSLLLVSFFVFLAMIATARIGILPVKQISIFPILIFILMSDKIVALQLERSMYEMVRITAITIIIGVLGYLFLSATLVQDIILLYPEIILLLIPVNILIGRYFGLRLTEYLRFSTLMKNGNK